MPKVMPTLFTFIIKTTKYQTDKANFLTTPTN